jgi:hypothetical protein
MVKDRTLLRLCDCGKRSVCHPLFSFCFSSPAFPRLYGYGGSEASPCPIRFKTGMTSRRAGIEEPAWRRESGTETPMQSPRAL